MTIKDGITHMYIADYNDANASERVVGSKFGDYARTYYPGYAQLSFHIMDWRGKQKKLDPIGQSIHCTPFQKPSPTL